MQLSKLICVFVIFLSIHHPSNAQSWVYYDIRNPDNQFSLQKSPNQSSWHDVAGDASFCNADNYFNCFNAGGFEFAIPKNINTNNKSWIYNDVTYKISRISNRYILGKKYLSYLIDRDFGNQKIRFVFTREKGLIGITTTGDNQGMFLILSGKCGYAAPAICYKNKQE